MRKQFRIDLGFVIFIFQSVCFAQQGFYASDVYFNPAGKGFVLSDSGRLYTTLNVGGAWTRQTLTMAGGIPDLKAIHFPTADVGYIVGATTILKTVDGGKTWNEPATTTLILNNVFFTSPTQGTATGLFVTATTEDGGVHWAQESYSITAPKPTSFNGLFFFGDSSGVFVGNNGEILKTPGVSIYPTDNDLMGVCFPTSSVGYAVGAKGTILKTMDAGVTWAEQMSGYGDDFADVFFVNANTGWAVGGSDIAPGIFKTTNGGATWTEYKGSYGSFPYGSLTSVFFTDANNGFTVGTSFFLKTTDGGVTWSSAMSAQPILFGMKSRSQATRQIESVDALGRANQIGNFVRGGTFRKGLGRIR